MTSEPFWGLDAENTDVAIGFFVEELLVLTSNADICVTQLRAAYALVENQNKAAFDEFFLAVQGILGSAASISKIFWPSVRSAKANKLRRRLERGRALCAEFGITGDSPLRVRNVRNNFEHLDEHLDDLAYACIQGELGVLVSFSFLGSERLINNEAGKEMIFNRVYIQDRDAIRLFDSEVIIHEYPEAIRDVREKCTAWKGEHKPDSEAGGETSASSGP